jgi:2-methylcitrate dehydratase
MTTRELASWVSALSYDDLPAPVIARAKEVIFDCLGACIFAGARTSWGKVAAEYAIANGGGQPEATVISTDRKSLAGPAALANGTMAEGFELGDFDPDTGTRPQPMTVPTALALVEARKRPGKVLIEAIVAGYEVNFRVGLGMNTSQRGRGFQDRGFYSGSVIGTFAAAAAGGKVLGLAPQEMTWALGIAGALTGGYFQGHEEGAWTRRLNAGMTTERGVQAALLAERGFVGPVMPLEGSFGFYHTFALGECDLTALTKDLGRSYKIMDTWIKLYPMNGTLHAPIEALLHIMKENDLRHTDIAKITATWYQYKPFLAKKDVQKIVSAQASLPFGLAATAVHGVCTVNEFTDQTLKDPVIRAMIERIDVADDPSLYERAGRRSVPGRVTVATNQGQSFTKEVIYPKGNARNPLSDAELRQKFAVLTEGVLTEGARAKIHQLVMDLENVSDIAEVLKLCATSAAAGPRTWSS